MIDDHEQVGSRRYRKRRRADQEQRTRERIAEAAVKLHGSVGPARTTVSGVAREAGVQRATVYRHFPTTESLFAACSAHYWALHPRPDPARWSEIADPAKRLRAGLEETYAFYARNEQMLEKTSRDAPLVEAMTSAREAFLGYIASITEALLRGRRERGRGRRRVAAAIGHAASFATWQSLARQQDLDDREAAALMAAMVEAAGSAGPEDR